MVSEGSESGDGEGGTMRCLWKKVADNDRKKINEGKKNITLGPDSPCHKCDGLDTRCETYRGCGVR